MKTVYIHIGTMKTGTSALQSFFRENREALGKHGYCFPFMKLNIRSNFNSRNGHFLVWQSEAKDEKQRLAEEKDMRVEAYKQLAGYAEKFDNIILTDEVIWKRCEYFENFWEDVQESFRKINCEVKVIVYLRRQDQMVQSLWNQLIKADAKKDKGFAECMETNFFRFFPLDYYKKLKEITSSVPKENVIVRVYEKGQFEGNGNTIFSDFMKCIGLEMTEEFSTEKITHNFGLRGNYVEIKRIINGTPEYKAMPDFMMRPILRASNCQPEEGLQNSVSMFPYEEQIEFVKKYEESNRKVAEEFLGKKDRDLFLEPVKKQPLWQINNETMYRDIILSFTEISCVHERKITHMQERIKSLEAQVAQLQKGSSAVKNDVTAMHQSLIFRGYRKMKKILKNQK